MDDNVRRKLEKAEREHQFMVDNAADFTGGPGETATTELAGVIADVHANASKQVSGTGTKSQMVANREDLFDHLIDLLKKINLAANAMTADHPGLDTKFRMPRNRANHNLLAVAKSFHDDAAPLGADFATYGVTAAVLTDLANTITAIETAGDTKASSAQSRAEATGDMTDAAKHLMDISRKLNSIVTIKYFDDPGKLAAWSIAHHLEKAPVKKDQAAGGTPTP
ncbi:MAG: hypothetical protein JO314_05315 [Acidobacteria bacterium]|nr:hypothetical protein [Acidobacteriota bacterium]